jgi:hypothetical protein
VTKHNEGNGITNLTGHETADLKFVYREKAKILVCCRSIKRNYIYQIPDLVAGYLAGYRILQIAGYPAGYPAEYLVNLLTVTMIIYQIFIKTLQ